MTFKGATIMATALVLGASILFSLSATMQGGGPDDRPATEKLNDKGDGMRLRKLTTEEEDVILKKGTERPFTGEFYRARGKGSYTCRQCGAELLSSDSKFESGCGWPSFDEALPGAVKEIPDRDGERTEIVCALCRGHLGHVFRGEGFTAKDTRHCVNSISLDFQLPRTAAEQTAGDARATGTSASEPQVAYFAGGCFWGVEYHLGKLPGVLSAVSGYMGGATQGPSYEEVCTGETGHAETVRVTFDPAIVSYETLARLFCEIHDPTQVNAQGPDRGTQYRSVVFVTSDEQREVSRRLVQELERRGYRVATSIEQEGDFWPAEDYHQDFILRTGQQCSHHRTKRFGD